MTRNRFMKIKQYLHFSDNEMSPLLEDKNYKLSKILPVDKHLQKKFQNYYTPERDVSIDESMMKFKGRLGWKQYCPLKVNKYGVKYFLLCESKSGYVYRFIVYVGKYTLYLPKYENNNIIDRYVLTLMDPLLGKGYFLTCDNFYTNYHLSKKWLGRTQIFMEQF